MRPTAPSHDVVQHTTQTLHNVLSARLRTTPPPFAHAETIEGTFGDEVCVIYPFKNNSGYNLALHYDQTVLNNDSQQTVNYCRINVRLQGQNDTQPIWVIPPKIHHRHRRAIIW